MCNIYKKYNLEANTIDFIGHAIALNTSDDYLDEPAINTIHKLKSHFEAEDAESPFLYPTFGLGGIPEAF